MRDSVNEDGNREAQGADEAAALSYLAEWINIQGDEGEVREMQERASRQIPEKVEAGNPDDTNERA
ncbi:hypothetical protein [Gorillibacterium sp. sgz5001074]|uniref:hypothetical protein n=1 Tax=Gorillibacterium sp. sgz5001074 TaxID=3446695 RepID=UPI003F6688B6